MAEDNKSGGVLGGFLALGVQEKLISVLVLGLILAAGFMGYFYGQLKVLKGGGVLGATNPTQANAPTAANPAAAAPEPTAVSDDVWQELISGAVAEKGPSDAKVVMVEFTDYQCPYCERHYTQTDPQIQKTYVETGKIRYMTRDLPLPFHANAHVAAEAARCAGDQGKYWEMHDLLFTNQGDWSEGDATAAFSKYAGEIGINVGTFDSCVSSGKFKQAVDDDLALANKAGANGTPTFIINGKLVVGAQPFSAFQSVIDGAL